jgi:hypothetical protein
LKAFATEDWPALRWAKRDGSVLSALRAACLRLRTHWQAASVHSTAVGALGFASFASFRFVFEAFVGEKHLFAGSKDKFSTAF